MVLFIDTCLLIGCLTEWIDGWMDGWLVGWMCRWMRGSGDKGSHASFNAIESAPELPGKAARALLIRCLRISVYLYI